MDSLIDVATTETPGRSRFAWRHVARLDMIQGVSIDRPKPMHALKVRVPCRADADDLRGVYELLARETGEKPTIRVSSQAGSGKLGDELSLQNVLTVRWYGRIQRIELRAADVTVSLLDTPWWTAQVAWTEGASEPLARRVHTLVRGWRRWWLTPLCDVWVAYTVVWCCLFALFIAGHLRSQAESSALLARALAEQSEMRERALADLRSKYSQEEIQAILAAAREKREPSQPPGVDGRAVHRDDEWDPGLGWAVSLVLLGAAGVYGAFRLLRPVLGWLHGQYTRVFPAFMFAFDSTRNAYLAGRLRQGMGAILFYGAAGATIYMAVSGALAP